MESFASPPTQIEFAPPAPLVAPAWQRHVPAGESIFTADDLRGCRYLLVSGEVVILRNGQIIDLVETGELLDPAIWPGAVAIAWHASILQPRE